MGKTRKQSKLNNGTYIVFIALLSMIPPLATDLYMPAMPEMVKLFNTTTATISFTMTIFFIFMAVGILTFGPMSDKYGRKRILLISIPITFTFSIVCAFAPTVELLIVARAIQAFGSGGMVAIATTLVKDSFDGPEMGKVLSITQALMLIAPMLAPIAGAVILSVASWHFTFIMIAVLNFITLLIALRLDETLPPERRTKGSTLQSILTIVKVVKDVRFTSLLFIGGLLSAPFMAYLSIASYIYVKHFETTELVFSIYFAITSAFAVLGPLLFMRMGRGNFRKVLLVSFTIVGSVGLLLLTIGQLSPVLFLISYVPFIILKTYLRPFISEAILSKQKENIGATSAMMSFGFTLIGTIGMTIGSLPWTNYVVSLGATLLIFGTLAVLVYTFGHKKGLFEGL